MLIMGKADKAVVSAILILAHSIIWYIYYIYFIAHSIIYIIWLKGYIIFFFRNQRMSNSPKISMQCLLSTWRDFNLNFMCFCSISGLAWPTDCFFFYALSLSTKRDGTHFESHFWRIPVARWSMESLLSDPGSKSWVYPATLCRCNNTIVGVRSATEKVVKWEIANWAQDYTGSAHVSVICMSGESLVSRNSLNNNHIPPSTFRSVSCCLV